jgi:hypothetical protein
MREVIQRLVRDASRPGRRFPIRSEKSYGHYAGLLPDRRQAPVICGNTPDVRVFLFSPEGDYLGHQRRSDAPERPPKEAGRPLSDRELDLFIRELHRFLADEFGFEPGLIHVKRFEEPAESVSVEPLPGYLVEFAADPEGVPEDRRPYHLAELERWVAEGDFVLNTWNDYWLDKDGEVISS